MGAVVVEIRDFTATNQMSAERGYPYFFLGKEISLTCLLSLAPMLTGTWDPPLAKITGLNVKSPQINKFVFGVHAFKIKEAPLRRGRSSYESIRFKRKHFVN